MSTAAHASLEATGSATDGATRTNPERALRVSMIGWLIVSTAVIVLVRDPAPGFVFDAAYYWAGADALTDQQDAYVVGGLDYRGLFTVFVHLPAILVSHAFGSSVTAASWIVLVQN